MKMKRIIAFVCVLVLATQALPVKQIGAVLFGNQINEEIPHSIDAGKSFGKEIYKADPFITAYQSEHCFKTSSCFNYVHFASLLPLNHAGDIHTPPPNIV